MSIHSHLYLKSGLGPGVDPKSHVERPLEVETWPKLIFTTFSNIFDWNRPIIWKSYQWKVINHFWRISTRVQVWPDFDLVPTANFFSSNLSKSQINFPPFGEKRKSKAHFYQKIYKFTFSPVANFTVKNSWTSGYLSSLWYLDWFWWSRGKNLLVSIFHCYAMLINYLWVQVSEFFQSLNWVLKQFSTEKPVYF